jgi:hypothetical protein
MRQIDQLTANPPTRKARGTWIVQAWMGQRKVQEESPDDLTLKHAQAIAREWSRGFDGYARIMPNAGNGRDYVEIWKDGKLARKGTFANTTLVRVPASNPSRKAQAFIGRKIRTLAREGMPAPRRVAAAYRLARRAGFRSVPKRARENPRTRRTLPPFSERTSWETVHAIGEHLYGAAHNHPGAAKDYGAQLMMLADDMLLQLQEGIHENPALAVLGNPPAKVVGTLSRRLYELRYKHAADGKDYRHPFGPGATVSLLADGSVWIHARHKLWEDI